MSPRIIEPSAPAFLAIREIRTKFARAMNAYQTLIVPHRWHAAMKNAWILANVPRMQIVQQQITVEYALASPVTQEIHTV